MKEKDLQAAIIELRGILDDDSDSDRYDTVCYTPQRRWCRTTS